jgi:hypothetical protein
VDEQQLDELVVDELVVDEQQLDELVLDVTSAHPRTTPIGHMPG